MGTKAATMYVRLGNNGLCTGVDGYNLATMGLGWASLGFDHDLRDDKYCAEMYNSSVKQRWGRGCTQLVNSKVYKGKKVSS